MTTADQLAARAMTLAAGVCDDDQAVAELRRLAAGDDQAIDQAILACLAQPASLAARRLAIELLARALYELLATHQGHGQVVRLDLPGLCVQGRTPAPGEGGDRPSGALADQGGVPRIAPLSTPNR
jgi:hypothetical protein